MSRTRLCVVSSAVLLAVVWVSENCAPAQVALKNERQTPLLAPPSTDVELRAAVVSLSRAMRPGTLGQTRQTLNNALSIRLRSRAMEL